MSAPQPKRRKNNFIDNKEFYSAIVNYRAKYKAAKEAGEDLPPMPRYLGKCFLDIAEHLSMRPNFSNYIYRQDMVMDAVENCVCYWYRFDPERSKNPFSYFTQVCWYAFIRRINKEKRQIDICDKIILALEKSQVFLLCIFVSYYRFHRTFQYILCFRQLCVTPCLILT